MEVRGEDRFVDFGGRPGGQFVEETQERNGLDVVRLGQEVDGLGVFVQPIVGSAADTRRRRRGKRDPPTECTNTPPPITSRMSPMLKTLAKGTPAGTAKMSPRMARFGSSTTAELRNSSLSIGKPAVRSASRERA